MTKDSRRPTTADRRRFLQVLYFRRGLLLFRRFGGGDLGYQHQRPYHDGAVGHIERRPVISPHREVEEVHHVSFQQPVPQIPQGAAHDERQSDAGGGHGVAVLPQQRRHHQQRDEREKDQHGHLPVGRRIREQPERSSAILHVGQAEEARDHV